jgi:hypothetical protein
VCILEDVLWCYCCYGSECRSSKRKCISEWNYQLSSANYENNVA